MKTFAHFLVVTLAAFSLRAAEPATNVAPASGVFDDVAKSAQRDLAAGSKELADLQDQIASEKLPLSQELTKLEDQLAQKRRDFESASRKADNSNIEVANLKTEMKARQDELQYVANILDEYARTLETKVNPVEMQNIGEEITKAKQLSENNDITQLEKFVRQVAFVAKTADRIAQVLGGQTFKGRAVGLDGGVRDGSFAIIGPVALFRALDGAVSGLALPQSGSPLPLVRPLEDVAMNSGLSDLVEKGKGTLPLDPSRGGALKQLIEKFNIVHVFIEGGPIMWPMLLVSVLAFGTVIERSIFLMIQRSRRDEKLVMAMFESVEHGRLDEAAKKGHGTKFYVAKMLVHALEHREKSLTNALLYGQAQEMKRFGRGIRMLDTCITLAPLLGLLGTVTGMMGSFSLIGGEMSSPGAITGGISEALIATAFGLGIAITAVIPFNMLNGKVEDARVEMETAATRLELLLHPPGTMAQAIAHSTHPQQMIPATSTLPGEAVLNKGEG